NYFNQNHGRPQTVALSRPLAAEHIQPPVNRPMQGVNRPQNNMQRNVRGNENARVSAGPVNQQPQHGLANPQPVQQRGLQGRPEPVQRGFGNVPQQRQEPVQQQRGFGNMPQARPDPVQRGRGSVQ